MSAECFPVVETILWNPNNEMKLLAARILVSQLSPYEFPRQSFPDFWQK
jgi:hypothetical protein